MELQVINAHVKRIKSIATGKFLAINQHGKVVTTVSLFVLTYARRVKTSTSTYFNVTHN